MWLAWLFNVNRIIVFLFSDSLFRILFIVLWLYFQYILRPILTSQRTYRLGSARDNAIGLSSVVFILNRQYRLAIRISAANG